MSIKIIENKLIHDSCALFLSMMTRSWKSWVRNFSVFLLPYIRTENRLVYGIAQVKVDQKPNLESKEQCDVQQGQSLRQGQEWAKINNKARRLKKEKSCSVMNCSRVVIYIYSPTLQMMPVWSWSSSGTSNWSTEVTEVTEWWLVGIMKGHSAVMLQLLPIIVAVSLVFVYSFWNEKYQSASLCFSQWPLFLAT